MKRLAALLAIAVVCTSSSAADFTGRVVSILDTDTIAIQTDDRTGYRVRLGGIDVPLRRA